MPAPRDLHHSQPLHAVDQMHRDPDPRIEAEADLRIDAAVEAERERARMQNNLMAFEIKLVGDRVQRQTHELRTLIDIERRREALEADQLTELRAMKAAMVDLAKPDTTQESILATLRDATEALNTLVLFVQMKTNGHAH